MHLRFVKYFLSFLIFVVFVSCKDYKYRIGVSQCGTDAWHAKMMEDLIREANSHLEVDLVTRVAEYSTEQQKADLEDLLNQHIDLLIVSPNHADDLVPIIEEFYDRGIPVIVVDRTLHSDKYTATVSSDDQDVGERIGSFIASELSGHGRILELTGTSTISTTIERHRGLTTELAKFPDIQIVSTQSADWNHDRALHITDSLLRLYPDIDLITAQNDMMAVGAYEACELLKLQKKPVIVGVDALPNYGLKYIAEGKLNASCINPSGAQEAFEIALNILEGKPFNRNTVLRTLLVDQDNVSLVQMYSKILEEYNQKIEDVNGELGLFWRRTRLLFALVVSFVVILSLVISMIIIIFRSHRVQERLRVKNLLLKLSHIDSSAKEKEPASQLEPVENHKRLPEEEEPESDSSPTETAFVSRIQEFIMANMSNPDLNVNELCSEMNMSRVQLYRKCKAQTDFSPVELIRIIRLKHAKHLLEVTQQSISEIAYEVGFSSPSYFAKCYRDQYGISPTELRRTL